MKLSNTLVAPLAAILIVTGAGAVLASTNNHPTDTSSAPAAAATATPAPGAPAKPTPPEPKPPKDLVIVLDNLVKDGTLSSAQETKILDGLVAQKLADRTAREALRTLMQSIVADGVITQDELDKLPSDSPLRDLSKLMTNGKITLDQMKSFGQALHGWPMGKGPAGPGAPKP